MRRFIRLTTVLIAAIAIAVTAAACGQQKIQIPHSDPDYKSDFAAAQLFHERCGGCHTLAYAATSGSGPNPRTYLDISGPNFNVRCERPIDRVLYAIENGGYGGAYMPQNIVVGQQAYAIAHFVSKFAGSEAPVQPDTTPCKDQTIGTLPPLPTSTTQAEADATPTGTTTTATQTTTNPKNVSSGSGKVTGGSNPSPNGGT